MDRAEQFRQLSRLAELRRDAESVELAQLRQRLAAVESQIAGLEAAAVDDMPDAEPTPFQRSGRAPYWDSWRQGRLRDLGMQAAGIRADIEASLAKVRVAFGRHQVLETLTDRIVRDPEGTGNDI